MGLSFSIAKRARMGESHIPEEILVEILRRLPRKSLCRFKCVSKQCCNLISDVISGRNGLLSITTPKGLLLQEGRSVKFLCLDNKGGASVDDSIHFNIKKNSSIYDSCNGFLLLGCRGKSLRKINYLVYNPIAGCSVHDLPPVSLQSYGASLVFDGNHYKVTCFSLSSTPSHLVFSVYSLEDKKWRQKDLHSPLEFTKSFSGDRPLVLIKALFFKRAMHWTVGDRILIYHLQGEFCKAIELPTLDPGQRCMWEFEGRLHYCHASSDKIKLWVLQMRDQKKYVPCKQCFMWQDKHSFVIAPPNSVIERPYHFSPFAFHEDFEILYVRYKKGVISYIPSTGEQKVAYVFPQTGREFILMKQPYTLAIDRSLGMQSSSVGSSSSFFWS